MKLIELHAWNLPKQQGCKTKLVYLHLLGEQTEGKLLPVPGNTDKC